MNEKLMELFQNKEFLNKIVACDTVDEVLGVIEAEGVETTKEEFDALMDNVARVRNSTGELGEEELENVSGGFAITAAGVALFGALVTAVSSAVLAAKWYIYDEPYSRGKQDAKAKNNQRKNKIC